MLEQTSGEFRELFLLKFTKQILENTQAYKSLMLKNEVKEVLRRKEESKILEMPYNIELQREELQKEKEEELKREQIREEVSRKMKAETRKISEIGKKNLSAELKIIANPVFRPEI